MATQTPSLQEYLAQARRGLLQSVLGPDYLMKQTYFTVDTNTNIFTATYGKKVWHALNNQTRFFNALPKTVWGGTVGWRIRTDRGANRSRPVTETGTLPTVDVEDLQVLSSNPRWVVTALGVSEKAKFVANLEGGVGDVLALAQENAQIDHIKEINEELLAGSAYIVSAGAATTFTVPASIAHHFKIGDAVSQLDVSDAGGNVIRTTGSVVSAVNTSTGVVTIATGTAFADGDIAFIYSRAGFTSLDDIVAEDVAETALTGVGGRASAVRAYDLTLQGRTAATWNAGAQVSYNAGVGRDLTLALIDGQIWRIRENGGRANLIVMGNDQYDRMERLLNTQQRYMGEQEFVVGIGNEKTYPGTKAGFRLATYKGIPVLPEADCPRSVATDDTVLGSNVYVLDTDYLEIAMARETWYVPNKDYFAVNALVERGLFITAGELRCKNFWVQAKICDLLR